MLSFMWSLWCALALASPSEADWQATIERVSPAVVSIQVTATRDFDTESASNSQGTGFVVDMERGLILTNRHMVHAGPVTARAIFQDNEEAVLRPIYRDPVHDFGFYQFDPDAIRYMEPVALNLDPTAPRVGMEIRVIGNDAGEKLSILDGTLARLDRNAPFYGRNTYNDFNTFYLQAASNTSGGSSGSPVIDVLGRVVGLNAGGRTQAASSFYLPLDRVVRALKALQEGREITRGTLQTTFMHRSYQDLSRLGLTDEMEAAARQHRPEDSGLLVVDRVGPGGPAAGRARVGDILLAIDDVEFPTFVDLAAYLDERPGEVVTLRLQRLGQEREEQVTVQDLHAITPDRFLEVGGAILHPLSYQQARLHHVPVEGLYLASSGYMLSSVPSGALITHLDGVEVGDLPSLRARLEALPDRERVRVRYVPLSDLSAPREVVQTVDRTWFTARECVRDDEAGTWPCEELPPPPRRPDPDEDAMSAPLPDAGKGLARRVGPALVLVEFRVPYSTAGVTGSSFVGTGVIVDATRGLVMVDRDTVPVALGDLTLTFGGTVRVDGEVVWIHPGHNVAFIRYDPKSIGDVSVEEVRLARRDPKKDEKVRLVGRDRAGRVVVDRVEVEDVDALVMGTDQTPRFRDANVEVVRLGKVERSVGGVLTNARGHVLGLWASYYVPGRRNRLFYGMPVRYFRDEVQQLREGVTPVWRHGGVEWRLLSLADARERGLSDERIAAYVRHDPQHLQVLEVDRVHSEWPASALLRRTDLLVLAHGSPVSRMRDLASWSSRAEVPLVVLRDGEEVAVDLPTQPGDARSVRRVVSWSGMLVHDPHQEVAMQKGVSSRGAYIAWYWYGSPASRDGVRPTRRIIKVGETPTPDLTAFYEAVLAHPPDQPVVLTMETLEGVEEVRAMEPDPHYWPLELLDGNDGRWRRVTP